MYDGDSFSQLSVSVPFIWGKYSPVSEQKQSEAELIVKQP